MLKLSVCSLAVALLLIATPSAAESACDQDGLQASGSIYRICMPSSGYNGMLIVWAHGFQDAHDPVSIPEDQLCASGFCVNQVVNDLGFAFATASYSKTGLAILQGQADIIDLVDIFTAQKGKPRKVYLVGASEGAIITALSLEQRPDLFSAGLAACGPVGHFPRQINYLGDARLTFDYFFPGLIPGDPFSPDSGVRAMWDEFYENTVRPFVFHPDNRHLLDQWVAVAQIPSDSANYLASIERSVRSILNYGVVNLNDVVDTLGGFPFDNRLRWYSGSTDDWALNMTIRRVAADPAAATAMNAYNTTGVLTRPLITIHTLRDEQVPFDHETIYDMKTLMSGALYIRHLNIPIDRFGHCNFTKEEIFLAFAVTLLYDGVTDFLSQISAVMTPQEVSAFEKKAKSVGLPVRRTGKTLSVRSRRR